MSEKINYDDQMISRISEMYTDIRYIRTELTSVKTRLENKYVTKEMFEPVKKIVYGLVGLVLTGVVLALIALVLESK